MKHILFYTAILSLTIFSCTDDRDIPSDAVIIDPNSVLVHYWNFNTLSGTVTSIEPDSTLVPGGAQISYPGTGDGYMDAFDPGYIINARNGDIEGSGFRARNPSDTRNVLMELPTTGYKSIVVQFASARSGSGATIQNYSYTIDGTNFITDGLSTTVFNPTEDPSISLVSLSFVGITGVEDNSNFKIKINFGGTAATGTSGNNRFDNVTLEGVPIAGTTPPDTTLYLFQYWNFNTVSGTVTTVAPDATLIASNTAVITYEGTGAGYMDGVDPGSAINAQNGDVPGFGIRARNPSDTRNFLIKAPTTGYKNVIVKFATAKSSAAGAAVQNYSYSLDGGITFISTGLAITTFSPNIEPAYDLVTIDFTAVTGANDNPDFIVRINFTGPEAAGASGNNRFDNITFQGNQL